MGNERRISELERAEGNAAERIEQLQITTVNMKLTINALEGRIGMQKNLIDNAHSDICILREAIKRLAQRIKEDN